MIWREAYRTRSLGPVALPPLSMLDLDGKAVAFEQPALIIGAFDPRAHREVELWSRLIGGSFPGYDPSFRLYLGGTDTRRREALAAIHPPSRHRQVRLAEDPDGAWRSLIEPDRPERSFGLIAVDGRSHRLMVGPPTEEAWEEFEAEALKIFGR